MKGYFKEHSDVGLAIDIITDEVERLNRMEIAGDIDKLDPGAYQLYRGLERLLDQRNQLLQFSLRFVEADEEIEEYLKKEFNYNKRGQH